MQILGFYRTPDGARNVRNEMLSSGFAPLEVGIYGGADTPATERQTWFAFAQSTDRQLYQEVTRNHRCTSITELVDLALQWLEERGPFQIEGHLYDNLRKAAAA